MAGEKEESDAGADKTKEANSQHSQAVGKDMYAQIASLAVAGAGLRSDNDVGAALDNLRTKRQAASLGIASRIFSELVREQPELAERVDAQAVREMAKLHNEVS